MKFYKFSVLLIAFLLVFGVKYSRSQDEGETTMEDMDEDQWEVQMNDLIARKNELNGKIAELQNEINSLVSTTNLKDAELKRAEDNFWGEVGGKDLYAPYKSNLERLEKLCRNKEGMKDDAEKLFNTLNDSKMRCHPEFFARIKSVKQCLDSWYSSVPEYTVMKGDYLFMIAAKREVYNNKHMWPVIWEANENGVISAPGRIPKTIRNPHLIYPGQVLRIPKLNESLKKSDVFERMKPWLDWKKRRHYKKH